jgi:tRNA G18 (ribose-2'-O)-methylase SpoU
MREKLKTKPDLISSSPEHQNALALGTDHFRLWERNVIDEFKSLTEEEIKIKLQASAFPYAVCFENVINDFNIASGIRNANAFNAKEVFYIGDKKIDRRGMQGVHNYTEVKWLSTIEEFLALKTTYKIVGFDNIKGATPISSYKWQPNTLIVFGSEGVGLSTSMKEMCEEFVYIEQFGSVRSLNVATASGIAMNDFVSKFRSHER